MFCPLVTLQNYLTLLDDEDHTLESLKIQDEQQLVIEGMKHLHFLPSFFQSFLQIYYCALRNRYFH